MNFTSSAFYFIFIAAGYLSGSILFGDFLLRKWRGVSIEEISDDGNPGTFNAFTYGGFWCGLFTLIGDIGKGALPVALCASLTDTFSPAFAAVMAAPVFGHAFSLYHHGQGGKAIAVSFGVLIGLLPTHFVVFVLVFYYLLFSLILRIRAHRTRSIVTFVCFFVSCFFLEKQASILFGCALISGIVILKHLRTPDAPHERSF